MTILRAFLYPLQSWRHARNVVLLALGLLIPYINLVLIINALLSMIRHMWDEVDEAPGLRLNHKEAITVLGGWGLAWFIPMLALDKVLTPYQPGHDSTLFSVCLVLLGVAFCAGLMRYAVTDDPYTLIQIPNNLILIWGHKLATLRFCLNVILYTILSVLFVEFISFRLINPLFDNDAPSFINAVLTLVWLAWVISGISVFFGQWTQVVDLDIPETTKRKNDWLTKSHAQLA